MVALDAEFSTQVAECELWCRKWLDGILLTEGEAHLLCTYV